MSILGKTNQFKVEEDKIGIIYILWVWWFKWKHAPRNIIPEIIGNKKKRGKFKTHSDMIEKMTKHYAQYNESMRPRDIKLK